LFPVHGGGGSRKTLYRPKEGLTKVTLICIIRCAKMMITHSTIQIISSETAMSNTVKQNGT